MPDINWVLVAPIIILQVILQVAALVSLFKTDQLRGQKWIWALIILVTGLIGPVLYFTIARKQF